MQDSLCRATACLRICMCCRDLIGMLYGHTRDQPGSRDEHVIRYAVYFELLKNWRKLYIYVVFRQIDLLPSL